MPLLAPLCTSLLHALVPTLRPADCTAARCSAHPACRPMAPTLSPGARCLALGAPRQPECQYSAGQPRFPARGHSRLCMRMRVIHPYYIRIYNTYTWNANSRAVHTICMQTPTVECIRTTHSEVVDQCVLEREQREWGMLLKEFL